MEKQEFIALLEKSLNGTANAVEQQMLANYGESFQTEANEDQLSEAVLQESEDRIYSTLQPLLTSTKPAVKRIHFVKTGWFRYAAMLLLIAGAGTYLFIERQPQKAVVVTEPLIMPGSDGAILTLADGSKISLDSMQEGAAFDQQGTKIRLKEGLLTYDASRAGEVQYNTINTPRGKQFKLVMPDGTRVWLDASSSIHYPTAFSGKERNVEITGQVYFEVEKDVSQPFTVSINSNTSVHVLGTSFNINSYQDEGLVKTTLVEGSVQMSYMKKMALLQPGQQALADETRGLKTKTVDVTKETAWKNGLFQFTNADLKKIMREFSRWYNVDVVYEGEVQARNFEGAIPRSLNLQDALAILKDNNVHFKLEGRKLIVFP